MNLHQRNRILYTLRGTLAATLMYFLIAFFPLSKHGLPLNGYNVWHMFWPYWILGGLPITLCTLYFLYTFLMHQSPK